MNIAEADYSLDFSQEVNLTLQRITLGDVAPKKQGDKSGICFLLHFKERAEPLALNTKYHDALNELCGGKLEGWFDRVMKNELHHLNFEIAPEKAAAAIY